MRVFRLGSQHRDLARETFEMMAAVFEEKTTRLGDIYIARLLARDDFWLFAALDDDNEVVGGLIAHALPMTRSESFELFIYDLAVHTEYQRQGVGRALVSALRDAADGAGIHVAFVPADAEDLHALDFYRAVGGVESSVKFFTFGED